MKLAALFLLLALCGCQAATAPASGPLFQHGGAISSDAGYSAWCVAHRGIGSCPP